MQLVLSKNNSAMRCIALVAVLLGMVASATPSLAAGPAGQARGAGRVVEQGDRVLAPFASVVFCMHQPDQCMDTGGADIVTLDRARRAEMTGVNHGFNHSIEPKSDAPGADVWSVDVKQGDCEDYALTKRKHLLALGWSSRALLIAVARTLSGEGHAVLIARTSDGDLVLDNRTDRIKDWRSTDLQWVMVQSDQAPRKWLSMEAAQIAPMMVSQQSFAPATAELISSRKGHTQTRKHRDTKETSNP